MTRDIRLTPYDEEFERALDEQEFDENAGDAAFGDDGSPPSMTIGHYPAPDNRMPMFLSSEAEEPMQRGFGSGGEIQDRPALRSRIFKAGIFTAVAAGIALAIASIDNPLALFANAKASLPGTSADQPGAAPSIAPPALQAAAGVQVSPPAASTKPTRDDIATALRSAQQVRPEIPQPKAALPPPPPPLRLEADELARLMKRARALIEVGDISPARLLLERAAEAQEASAALLLAQTYDPAVLGTQDQRSITADPAMARAWYQKAAQLGSPDALGRLAQIQN